MVSILPLISKIFQAFGDKVEIFVYIFTFYIYTERQNIPV